MGKKRENMYMLDKFRYCPVCGSKHFEESTAKSKRCRNCGFEYFLNASSATAAFILNGRGELLVERRKEEPGRAASATQARRWKKAWCARYWRRLD